jgi:hypothetical protein
LGGAVCANTGPAASARAVAAVRISRVIIGSFVQRLAIKLGRFAAIYD